MAQSAGKSKWVLLLVILSGIVLGGFIGHLCKDVSWLSWLSYGETFGLAEPVVLDLGIMLLTFGLVITINIASIIGMVIGIILYKKL